MGGKTQQRVAGNAKPTNSGRIRGLLINQQMVPSNIITFSALNAKRQPKEEPAPVVRSEGTSTGSVTEHELPVQDATQLAASSATNPQGHEIRSILQQPTTPTKGSTKLVVRRVGNRELYTRVRFEDDLTSSANSPQEATGQSSNADPIDQQHESIVAEDSKNSDATRCDGRDIGDTDEHVPLPESGECDEDEKLTFDELLDKLDKFKIQPDPTNVKSKLSSLRDLDEASVGHEAQLLKIFSVMLKKHCNDLSIEDWDILVNSLNKWVNWVYKSDYPLAESYQAEFCAKVFKFIHQLIIFAEKLQKDITISQDLPMMQSLLDDWANFRSSTMFLNLITLYLKLISAENSEQEAQVNSTVGPMIEALAHIIVTVDPRMVLSHHNLSDYLDSRVDFDQDFKTPDNSLFCDIDSKKSKGFLAICSLLRSNTRVITVSAHAILSKVLDSTCENAQTSALISDHEAVDDVLIFPPAALMAILTSRDSMMSALLSDYRVGDISVTIEPNTDSYACTLSYLFTWDLVIQFIVGVEKEVGQSIIHSLKKLGLIQRLLDNIFILLPPLDARDCLDFRFESSLKDSHIHDETWCLKQFLKSPLATTIDRPVNEVELVALHLYFSVALHMPVTVRKWYNNNANKKLCNLVNEYTVKHISQLICSIEMESVFEKCQERNHKLESNNLTIKARPSAKEVYAIYTRDEFKMELTIKLPLNYPLGSVQIDGGKRVGVTDVKWRSWLLQLTTFLAHQNGPILDGIDLWRKNIDKRFEGVEKCTICFSILHSNYQLPKKRCQTCANMFHNLCLYKWFESSGNSTCPLCRNPW